MYLKQITPGLPDCSMTSERVRSLLAGFRSAWQRLAAVRSRRRLSEHERTLADSVDRFELERREQMWNRWSDSEGSLLGR
jgi:hypothetical protein